MSIIQQFLDESKIEETKTAILNGLDIIRNNMFNDTRWKGIYKNLIADERIQSALKATFPQKGGRRGSQLGGLFTGQNPFTFEFVDGPGSMLVAVLMFGVAVIGMILDARANTVGPNGTFPNGTFPNGTFPGPGGARKYRKSRRTRKHKKIESK